MSIFGRTTFSAAAYAAYRPSYPPSLFSRVLSLHDSAGAGAARPPPNGGGRHTLLDLGCGHGLVARALAPSFDRVIGVDPSAGMISQARSTTSAANVEFRHGPAEDLGFLGRGEADVAVAGQAVHWFDLGKEGGGGDRGIWGELARVVRSRGTLAVWGYKDNVLVGQPRATAIFDEFTYGTGEVARGMEGMGGYWEKPGRDILRDSLRAVRPPPEDWELLVREVYEPDRETCEVEGADDEGQAWMRKGMKLGEFEGYVRSFSAYRGWTDAHAGARSRAADGGEGAGDVVDVMFERMVEAVPEWGAMGDAWREAEVEAVWGTSLIVARRL